MKQRVATLIFCNPKLEFLVWTEAGTFQQELRPLLLWPRVARFCETFFFMTSNHREIEPETFSSGADASDCCETTKYEVDLSLPNFA